jgi:hypothetical protein
VSFSRDILPWILGAAGVGLGLGSFGIGPLAFLGGAGAAGGVGAGLSSGFVPTAAKTGIGAILSSPAKFGMAFAGLSGIGALANHLQNKSAMAAQEKEDEATAERTKEQRLSRNITPAPEDYKPGFDEEWNYFSQPQYKKFAEGGPVTGQQFDPMQSGIEATVGGARSSIRQNDKQLVKEAIKALMGQSPDEETAIGNFMARFGREALADLVQNVRGELMQMQSQNGRLISGPGDGKSDSIPAYIDERIPAKLSTGEYVAPADKVAALGGGDPATGAKELEYMIDRAIGRQ